MSKKHTSYKCKRCDTKIDFYSNVKKHINKKKICDKNIDVSTYSDDQLLVCTLLPYIDDVHCINNNDIEYLKDSNTIFNNKNKLIEILDDIDKKKIKVCKMCDTEFSKSTDLKKHIILNCFHKNYEENEPKLNINELLNNISTTVSKQPVANNVYIVSPDGKSSSFSAVATDGNPINLDNIPNICIPGFGNNGQPFNIIESIVKSIKENGSSDSVEIKEITCNTVRSGINNCDTTNNINIRIEIKNINNFEEIINVLRKTLTGLNLLTNDVIEEVLVNVKKVIQQKQLEYKKAMLSYLVYNMLEMKLQEEFGLLELLRNRLANDANDTHDDTHDTHDDAHDDAHDANNLKINTDYNSENEDFEIGEIKINEDYYKNGRFEY